MTPVIISNYSPQALTFIKSLSELGFSPAFICIKKNHERILFSKFLNNVYYLDSQKVLTAEGMDLIIDFLNRFESCALVAINEKISIWLWEHVSVLHKKCRLLLPPKDILLNILSKKKQLKAAEKARLNVLPTYWLTKDSRTWEKIPQNHYPVCVRPSGLDAVKPAFKAEVISNTKEMDSFVNNTERINQYIIAQPFLDLPNLVVHGSRKTDGSTIGFQGFLAERKFEGLTLTIKPFPVSESLKNRCLTFIEMMGVRGPYHFDFLYNPDNHEAWFLELNNRLGGTTAKVFALGYDEPRHLLQSFGYDVGLPGKKLIASIASSKMALMKYLYFTLAHKINVLDYPACENRSKRIAETLKALLLYRDDILGLNDARAVLSFYASGIWQKLTPIQS